MPPNPPSKRVALPRAAWRFAPCKYPHFSRKILNPPRNEILDTPLHLTLNICIQGIKNTYVERTLHNPITQDLLQKYPQYFSCIFAKIFT